MMILKYPWFGFESATVGLKISFLTVSVWWLCFVLPALFSIQEQGDASTELSVGIRHYVSKLWMTLKSLPAQKSLLLFILSFAFFNEGVQTVISMSTLFGKEVIQLSEQTLIGTLLMVQILGLPFTLSMSKATKFFGPKRVLIAAVLFWIGIVTYAHWMQHAYEFWILGVLVALVIGVSQALPRSIFASLIPRRRQAEYFSFFALSGKMTSLLGPLTFGLIRDLTGNPRLSILSLGAFFVLGLILLLFVSIDPQKVERID
jgi:UMF1 family MFS transporter